MVKIVKAESIEDYLNKYYKQNKMTDTLLASYTEEYKRRGYICTSYHDNVIGEFIAWPHYPGNDRKI